MHRCFLIPDIVHLISCEINGFPHRNRGPPDPNSRTPCLIAFAQTCRTFQEPALDCLWGRIDDITLLIRCMPSDLWMVESTGRDKRITFQRPIKPTDLPRFLVHAHRVRILINRFVPLIPPEVCQELCIAAGTGVLLPNIKQLVWVPKNDAELSCIHHFLGPQLESISLLFYRPFLTPSLHSILTKLSIQFPFLTHVIISPSDDSSIDPDVISEAVCRWNKLRQLSVTNLSAGALMHLATLPDLQDLSLVTSETSIPDHEFAPPHVTAFRSLQSLTICSPGVAFATRIVKTWSWPPALKTVAIRPKGDDSSSLLEDLFHALNQRCHHSSIEGLSLGNCADTSLREQVFREGFQVRMEHIEPLLVFSNLITLSLVPSGELDLDNAVVDVMAQAWPRIQRLELGHPRMPSRPSRVTLQGLISFAKHCPRLMDLSISLNAGATELEERKPGSGVYSETLISLDVLTSPIECSAKVAAFLSDIFPNLSCLVASRYGAPNPADRDALLEWERKWVKTRYLITTARAQAHPYRTSETPKIDYDDSHRPYRFLPDVRLEYRKENVRRRLALKFEA